MVLTLPEEHKYVLDVQAANRFTLSKKDWKSKTKNNQILQAGKKANKILTDENYYLILQEVQRFYPYQELANYSVEYAEQHSWQEYVNEGVIGLHHAIIRFEISRGFRLNSFAVNWIRGSISRLSRQKNNINISYEEAEKYCLTAENEQQVVSISSKELELINRFVNSLNPIDKDILNRCFGLNNYKKNSLIAIGRCNNLNPKQVSRRRDRILRKLRNLLENENKSEQNKALLHYLNNDISLLAS